MAKPPSSRLYIRHGRIRSIKPEFFLNEKLFDLEQRDDFKGLPLRLAFAGLWTQCDKNGRFKWQPRYLKTQILPYDEVDFLRVLDALTTRHHVVKYEIAGEVYGCIPSWHRHQSPNNRESESLIPSPNLESLEAAERQAILDFNSTRDSRVDDAYDTRESRHLQENQGEGNGREGNGRTTVPNGTVVCAETSSPAPAAALAVMRLATDNGRAYEATADLIAQWQTLYPDIGVTQSLRNMQGWLEANPSRRKTAKGMPRFIHTWLRKDQENASDKAKPLDPKVWAEKNPRIYQDFCKMLKQRFQAAVGSEISDQQYRNAVIRVAADVGVPEHIALALEKV